MRVYNFGDDIIVSPSRHGLKNFWCGKCYDDVRCIHKRYNEKVSVNKETINHDIKFPTNKDGRFDLDSICYVSKKYGKPYRINGDKNLRRQVKEIKRSDKVSTFLIDKRKYFHLEDKSLDEWEAFSMNADYNIFSKPIAIEI